MPIFLDLLEHDDRDRRYFAVFQLGELALRGVDLRQGLGSDFRLTRTRPTGFIYRHRMAILVQRNRCTATNERHAFPMSARYEGQPRIRHGLLEQPRRRAGCANTGGFFDHVFAMCRLLGFRFAPGIRDLKEVVFPHTQAGRE